MSFAGRSRTRSAKTPRGQKGKKPCPSLIYTQTIYNNNNTANPYIYLHLGILWAQQWQSGRRLYICRVYTSRRAWHVYTTIYYYYIIYTTAPRRNHSSVRRGALRSDSPCFPLLGLNNYDIFSIVRVHIILHINTYLPTYTGSTTCVCNAITAPRVLGSLWISILIEFFFFRLYNLCTST